MNKEMRLIIEIRKSEKMNETQLFEIVKKIIDKNESEYPSFALVSMILDSIEAKSDIFKLEKELPSSPLQIEFKEIK